MSEKNTSDIWKDFCARESDIKMVNKLSKEIRLRPDWGEVKISIMEDLIKIKFEDKDLKEKLLQTGDSEIQEGNTWGDTHWGVDLESGEGKNLLGQMIMSTRTKCKKRINS